MANVCKICGCTDDKPCITEEGPCSWVMKDLCSACVVIFPRGQHSMGKCELIVPKECRNCAYLQEVAVSEDILKSGEAYTCSKARFLHEGVPQWYAWRGISRPNKAVARAQAKCPFFEVAPRYLPPAPKQTQVDMEEVEKLWKSGEGMIQNPIKREES